jgi:hypothetical protein
VAARGRSRRPHFPPFFGAEGGGMLTGSRARTTSTVEDPSRWCCWVEEVAAICCSAAMFTSMSRVTCRRKVPTTMVKKPHTSVATCLPVCSSCGIPGPPGVGSHAALCVCLRACLLAYLLACFVSLLLWIPVGLFVCMSVVFWFVSSFARSVCFFL